MSFVALVAKPHRWTRTEYERMVEAGVFHPDARFELIDGEIIDMVPQSSYHATSIQVMADYIRNLFGADYHVRIQMPLALGESSEPEPDVAVVMGSFMDYRHAHPQIAALVVEVANSTLAYDRLKASMYASHGIPEYWLANLKENCLEVFQQPENGRYTSYRCLKAGSAFVCGNGKPVAVDNVLV